MDSKKLELILSLSHKAGFTLITREYLQEQYNNMLQRYGKEQADKATENTLKNIKGIANKAEKELWQGVKREILSVFKSSPTSTRDIKALCKSGDIDITRLPSCTKIKESLGIAKE